MGRGGEEEHADIFRYGRGFYKVYAVKLFSISIQRKTNVIGKMQNWCSIGYKSPTLRMSKHWNNSLGGLGEFHAQGETAWAAGSSRNTWAASVCTK